MKNGKYVLLVEDDIDICDSLCEVLQTENIDVRTAFNGEEAIKFLLTNPAPCLVLLDIRMPQTDGFWFYHEKLKHPQLADIPVVIMSADGQIEARAQSLHVSGILRKPVGISTLLRTVNSFMGNGPVQSRLKMEHC